MRQDLLSCQRLCFFSWQRYETRELWCLSGGLNSKGFIFWNQALHLLRNFSSFECHRGMQVCWRSPLLLKNRPLFCWRFNSFSSCVRGVFTFLNLCAPFVSVLCIWYVFIPCTLWNHIVFRWALTIGPCLIIKNQETVIFLSFSSLLREELRSNKLWSFPQFQRVYKWWCLPQTGEGPWNATSWGVLESDSPGAFLLCHLQVIWPWTSFKYFFFPFDW